MVRTKCQDEKHLRQHRQYHWNMQAIHDMFSNPSTRIHLQSEPLIPMRWECVAFHRGGLDELGWEKATRAIIDQIGTQGVTTIGIGGRISSISSSIGLGFLLFRRFTTLETQPKAERNKKTRVILDCEDGDRFQPFYINNIIIGNDIFGQVDLFLASSL